MAPNKQINVEQVENAARIANAHEFIKNPRRVQDNLLGPSYMEVRGKGNRLIGNTVIRLRLFHL